MKFDIRYNLQHIGNFFVGTVQNTANSALDFSNAAIRRYEINSLHSKKEKICRDIVEYVSFLIKEGDSPVCRDTTLSRLVTKLTGIEKQLAGYKKYRAKLTTPIKSIITKLGTSILSVKKWK